MKNVILHKIHVIQNSTSQYTSTKVKSHPLFFQICCLLFFKTGKTLNPKCFYIAIFQNELDHGLQFVLYLKLIMKSNCWLLQVKKMEITRTF